RHRAPCPCNGLPGNRRSTGSACPRPEFDARACMQCANFGADAVQLENHCQRDTQFLRIYQKARQIVCHSKTNQTGSSILNQGTIMPSVVFAIDSLLGGGAEKVVLTLAEGFARRGYQSHILTFSKGQDLECPEAV